MVVPPEDLFARLINDKDSTFSESEVLSLMSGVVSSVEEADDYEVSGGSREDLR